MHTTAISANIAPKSRLSATVASADAPLKTIAYRGIISGQHADERRAERAGKPGDRADKELRQQHGCPARQVSPGLTVAARLHSREMADHNYLDHIDLSGQHSDWRAEQAGYTGLAGCENIAAGYTTAEDVVSGWYNETPPDDGHRRNMLNCELTAIGAGYATNPNSDYGTYWTQDFGE
jgi:hypothetical protein